MESTDKRIAVIQATIELVAEYGFHGSPMSQVAKRAGVAAGTYIIILRVKTRS